MPVTNWHAIFEERYGEGSLDRLIEQLRQPCITFAAIAKTFGVSRERVRQWQLELLPDAPRGHERQQQCGRYRQKRKLLEDPLFRSFYRHARPHLHSARIELVRARDGYHARAVQIDHRLVAIRDVSKSARRGHDNGVVYTLPRAGAAAELIYYRLAEDDYLFLPASELPRRGASFVDEPASKYYAFKNTFDALRAADVRHTA